MASSKELFISTMDDQSHKKMIGMVKSAEFERLIAFARAEFSQNNPTADQCTGANNFVSILENLPDDETEAAAWVKCGIHHDLSVPDRSKTK